MKKIIDFILSLFKSKKETNKINKIVRVGPEKGPIVEIPKNTTVVVDNTLNDYEEENKKAKEQKAKKNIEILPIQIKNENDRIKDELLKLKSKNKELYNLLIDVNKFTNREFKKSIMITMIYRTQSEQDYLYRNSAKYKKRKFKSPHQFWHAIDLRSRTFTSYEIKKIVEYINKKYNKSNYYRWTAKNHTIGHGMHFHIQFIKA